MLARVFEMQHRGVLHVHPVLAYGTYAERRTADRYLDLVNELRRTTALASLNANAELCQPAPPPRTCRLLRDRQEGKDPLTRRPHR
jgi:hypothetical protein